MARILFLNIVFLLVISDACFAKTFQTKFIKLELPPNWDCKKEELDYVCQPDNVAERSEVIMIVVTKAVNAVDDNLEKYKTVLSTPRAMTDLLGTSYKAEIKYVKEKRIQDRTWIDSLHKGSEIPGFYSRYLAGINEKVAGLITYSIAESVYPKWAATMDQMVDTLVLSYDAKAFEEAMNSGPGSLLGSRARTKDRFAPTLDADGAADETKSPGSGLDSSQMLGIGIAVAALAYLIWKKRKK